MTNQRSLGPRSYRVAAVQATILAVIALCGCRSGEERQDLHRGVIGQWDWADGAVPDNAGLFRYWIFSRDGEWSVSDGACLLNAGSFSVEGDKLILQESEEYSSDADRYEYRISFNGTKQLKMSTQDGQTSLWRRLETSISSAHIPAH